MQREHWVELRVAVRPPQRQDRVHALHQVEPELSGLPRVRKIRNNRMSCVRLWIAQKIWRVLDNLPSPLGPSRNFRIPQESRKTQELAERQPTFRNQAVRGEGGASKDLCELTTEDNIERAHLVWCWCGPWWWRPDTTCRCFGFLKASWKWATTDWD